MNDLTLLYYSAHTLWENCAENVRHHILEVTNNEIPIVSVTQKPLNFGKNICVGDIGKSYQNCYLQILVGAISAKTKYIACIEDDTLYPREHFDHRPSVDDVFAYNNNMWFSEEKGYWGKENDYGMCGCIAPRELLIKTLRARFRKYPYPIPADDKKGQKYWQEPGRFDHKFGIPNAKIEMFKTEAPLITFNYYKGLGGKKRDDSQWAQKRDYLAYWGDGKLLWHKFWIDKHE